MCISQWYGEGLKRLMCTSYYDGEKFTDTCGRIQPYFHTKDHLFG